MRSICAPDLMIASNETAFFLGAMMGKGREGGEGGVVGRKLRDRLDPHPWTIYSFHHRSMSRDASICRPSGFMYCPMTFD